MGMFGKLGWELGINAPIGMETSNGCGYNAHSTKEQREAAEKKKTGGKAGEKAGRNGPAEHLIHYWRPLAATLFAQPPNRY